MAGWTGLPPQDGQELPRPGQPSHQAVHGVAGHPAESDPDLRGWVLGYWFVGTPIHVYS